MAGDLKCKIVITDISYNCERRKGGKWRVTFICEGSKIYDVDGYDNKGYICFSYKLYDKKGHKIDEWWSVYGKQLYEDDDFYDFDTIILEELESGEYTLEIFDYKD